MPQTIGPNGWPKGKIDPKSAPILPSLSLYRKHRRQTLPFSQQEALLGFSPSSWSSKLKHISLRVSCSYPYTLFASWTCVFPLGITVVICPCSIVFIFNSLNCLRNCGVPLFVSKIPLSSSFQVIEARVSRHFYFMRLMFCEIWETFGENVSFWYISELGVQISMKLWYLTLFLVFRMRRAVAGRLCIFLICVVLVKLTFPTH